MIKLMYKHDGVGLSANQVGLDLKFFVYDIGEGPVTVVNPSLGGARGSNVLEEGCLSIPGEVYEIKRAHSVLLRAKTIQGEPMVKLATGFLARVFQHEVDHLNGKLITEYVTE